MKKYLIPIVVLAIAIISFGVVKWLVSGETLDAVFEQEPVSGAKISLVAPIEARIGELVILDASESEAAAFIWKVVPETRDFQIIEDGRRAFFTSRRPGTYLFVIAAAKADDVDCILHEIQIIGNPTIEDEFMILVKSWLPSEPDPRILQALARSFIASTNTEDVATLVKQTSVANQAVLGSKLAAYKPFLIKFSEYLKQNYSDKSFEEHVTLWLKLAETLKSC